MAFDNLTEIFKDSPRLLKTTCALFDAAFAMTEQRMDNRILAGLAALLVDLGDLPPQYDTNGYPFHFNIDLLRSMQALRAAYQLGLRRGRRSIRQPR
jgi:hypothetical protein